MTNKWILKQLNMLLQLDSINIFTIIFYSEILMFICDTEGL